jgi:hypothetical protein
MRLRIVPTADPRHALIRHAQLEALRGLLAQQPRSQR